MQPSIPVGFDYQRAVLELRNRYTYERMAEFCGFSDKVAVFRVASGLSIPSHPQGEALFVLYVETFHDKPPMTQAQFAGAEFVSPVKRHLATSSA